MDNLCHTLVGAALGRAGLNQTTRFASATLMIAANLPDIDVLVLATGVPPVAFRRGWTHGVVAQLALPLLLTAIVGVVGRRRRDSGTSPPLRLPWVLALAVIGLYSHLFLDYLNNYGVRLLSPVDWRWFYGDAVFIIDPWLWTSLGAGVWYARRSGRARMARAALLFAGAYTAIMLVSARVAREVVLERWTATNGVPPVGLMVGPRPVTPFTREVIVDAGDHYQRGRFAWPAALTMVAPGVPKNHLVPEVRLAQQAANVRAFLVWSRFPFWEIERRREGGTRVTVKDMRFGDRFAASTTVP